MMNKKTLLAIALGWIGLSMNAQDIYQMNSLSTTDLNGTARYVGMGGAMNALGADLSTLNSNPAGIGLYRRSEVAGTVGLSMQEEGQNFEGKRKNTFGFDQFGFVYAMEADMSSTRFVNFGFNYKKHRNFNQLINAAQSFGGNEGGPSQTWHMCDMDEGWGGPTNASPLTNMGYETYLYDYDHETGEGNVYNASQNAYAQYMRGNVQEYDVTLGFNFDDRWYLGMGVGLYSVDYKSFSNYAEELVGYDGTKGYYAGVYDLYNRRKITGSGVDFKLGVIVRPIEDNPFRIGFSFTTPTNYSITQRQTAEIQAGYSNGNNSSYSYELMNRYNIKTPWKFNLSAGSTFMNQLALGVEYEYSDYSCAKVTYDNNYYDPWGNSEDTDDALEREAEKNLKGVHTFKVGAEWYVDPQLAIRLGYNYVSAPVEKNAIYNQTINSASLDYCTTSAFMNPSAINRITVGMGTNFGNWYADLAYMYQKQSADFYAFDPAYGKDAGVNLCNKLNLNKSKVMLTIGYRF